MVTPNHVSNKLDQKSTIFCFFIQLSCVVSFPHKEDDGTSGEPSSQSGGKIINTPKKIIKKIGKVIVPIKCMMNLKKKPPQEESPPPSPKQKMKKIVSKVIVPNACLKIGKDEDSKGCLWKKTILMGEKCQPLEFPGAIFYDSEGNQISEPPRSPKSGSFGSPFPKVVDIEM